MSKYYEEVTVKNALEYLALFIKDDEDFTCEDIQDLMKRMQPAADIKPVVRGKWISRDKRGSHVCSICGDEWVFNPDHGGFCYCPHCGADMREGEE